MNSEILKLADVRCTVKIILHFMEDKNITPEVAEPTSISEDEGKTEQKFTQEELDKILQKRLADEKKAEEKRLADFQKQMQETIKKEREEAERLAKLSAEEKEREQAEKQRKEIESKSNEVTLRENRLDAQEALLNEGLPKELGELVIDVDKDKQSEKIGKLLEAWKPALQKAVEEHLKGTPPKDLGSTPKPVLDVPRVI